VTQHYRNYTFRNSNGFLPFGDVSTFELKYFRIGKLFLIYIENCVLHLNNNNSK